MTSSKENEKELEEILKKTKSLSLSLKELSELYFKAKEKIFSREEITKTEVLIATNIFLNGYIKVGEYLFRKEMKDLTDEELETLLTLCDEASVNFDYLTELFFSGDDEKLSSVFSQERNEEKQEKIKSIRESAIKEKAKRKVQQENGDNSENKSKTDDNVNELLNESSKKRISELQKEVDFLRKKNKSKEADRLQKKVDKISNPEKNNPEKNNNSFSPSSFLAGVGIVLVIIGFIVFLVIRIRKKK